MDSIGDVQSTTLGKISVSSKSDSTAMATPEKDDDEVDLARYSALAQHRLPLAPITEADAEESDMPDVSTK